jgi:phage-related protein
LSYVKIRDVVLGSNKRIMLTGITNTANGETSRRETAYAGYDGADFEDITLRPRMVTVNGTLFGTTLQDIDELKRTLIDACNPKEEAEVRYHNGAREYYAKALPTLPTFNKISNTVYQFIIYLEISKFYWLSSTDIVQGVFRTINNIYGEDISLPRPFSLREQGADIYNHGSVAAPLIIELTATESFTDTIVIKNTTYNKEIRIENYSVTAGEVITINTDEYTVTSSLNGNIISYISENSELFNLPCGLTRIECERVGLTIVTKYRERFLGV